MVLHPSILNIKFKSVIYVCSLMNIQALLDGISLIAAFMLTFEDFVRLMSFLVILEMGLSWICLATILTFEIL